MKLSQREILLFWATGVAALAGVSYMIAGPKVTEWKALREAEAEAARKIALSERLVAQAPQWETKLGELRKRLPVYPREKDVTADLLIRLEQIAEQSGLQLLSRDVEREAQHGDLFELAVNCKWEGRLESVVQFLFDLQSQDVILDAGQLNITPNERKMPRGSFTVNCSYARVASPSAPSAPLAPAQDNRGPP